MKTPFGIFILRVYSEPFGLYVLTCASFLLQGDSVPHVLWHSKRVLLPGSQRLGEPKERALALTWLTRSTKLVHRLGQDEIFFPEMLLLHSRTSPLIAVYHFQVRVYPLSLTLCLEKDQSWFVYAICRSLTTPLKNESKSSQGNILIRPKSEKEKNTQNCLGDFICFGLFWTWPQSKEEGGAWHFCPRPCRVSLQKQTGSQNKEHTVSWTAITWAWVVFKD